MARKLYDKREGKECNSKKRSFQEVQFPSGGQVLTTPSIQALRKLQPEELRGERAYGVRFGHGVYIRPRVARSKAINHEAREFLWYMPASPPLQTLNRNKNNPESEPYPPYTHPQQSTVNIQRTIAVLNWPTI